MMSINPNRIILVLILFNQTSQNNWALNKWLTAEMCRLAKKKKTGVHFNNAYTLLLFSLKWAITERLGAQGSNGRVSLTELHGFSSKIKSDALTVGTWEFEGKINYNSNLSPMRSAEDKSQVCIPCLCRDTLYSILSSKVSRHLL